MTMPPLPCFAAASIPRGFAARWVTAWVLLFVQVLAFLHLGIAPHRIDTMTGKVLHVEPGPSDDVPTSPSPGDSQDPCVIFSALTQAAGFTAPWMGLGEIPALRVSHVPLPMEPPPRSRRDLHRLSPSNSPPAVV